METNRKHEMSELPRAHRMIGNLNPPGVVIPLAPVKVHCGELEIDRSKRSVVLAGTPLTLTAREYALLMYLVERVNRVVKRADLLAKIWTLPDDHESNLVDVFVRRLRQKLGAHAGMIETIRGFGYCLRPVLGA